MLRYVGEKLPRRRTTRDKSDPKSGRLGGSAAGKRHGKQGVKKTGQSTPGKGRKKQKGKKVSGRVLQKRRAEYDKGPKVKKGGWEARTKQARIREMAEILVRHSGERLSMQEALKRAPQALKERARTRDTRTQESEGGWLDMLHKSPGYVKSDDIEERASRSIRRQREQRENKRVEEIEIPPGIDVNNVRDKAAIMQRNTGREFDDCFRRVLEAEIIKQKYANRPRPSETRRRPRDRFYDF